MTAEDGEREGAEDSADTFEHTLRSLRPTSILNIIVPKMTPSNCAGTVQMREESESGIRKREEM